MNSSGFCDTTELTGQLRFWHNFRLAAGLRPPGIYAIFFTKIKLKDWCRTDRLARLGAVVVALFLVSLNAGCEKIIGEPTQLRGASDGPGIGRMKVSIMPEYDDTSVLVIYDGRFEEAPSYPIKTSFLVPRGSVISDACSLSHEGRHFCQLYKTVNRGKYDEVNLLLPYPNYYLSFHTPHIDAEVERKEIQYPIRSNHRIRKMEVDVQQPLRSTAFAVSPPKSAAISGEGGPTGVIDGFNHLVYRIEEVDANQELTFSINYLKSDPNPSVNIKYTSMREPQSPETAYEGQRNVKTMLYLLFATGALGIVALLAWYLRSKRAGRSS